MGKIYSEKCRAERVFEPADEPMITAFEEMLGSRLPEEYRQFLADWNGANFYPTFQEAGDFVAAFPTQSISDHSEHVPDWAHWLPSSRRSIYDSIDDLTVLYGIGKKSGFELSKTNPGYSFELWAPERFLAIGRPGDGCGHVCISLSEPDCGNIYNWVWPEEMPKPSENCPTMHYFHWIAADFKEFWDVLRPMSQAEVEKWKWLDDGKIV
jgi:hypothetical protein